MDRCDDNKGLNHIAYTPDTPSCALMPEGRIMRTGAGWHWEYHLRDHLGNTRLTIADTAGRGVAVVLQSTHYYPFGMSIATLSHTTAGHANPWLYNGKEHQPDFDLGWYDYGWRMYDASICRWHCVDKLSEMYYSLSNYTYCANNPVRLIDIDGRYYDDRNGKRAERMEKRITNKQDRLANKVRRMEARGSDTEDLRARIEELGKSVNDYQQMRDDPKTEFQFASVNSASARKHKVTGPETIQTGTNSKGDKVVTMFSDGTMGIKIHEARHGGDVARGTLILGSKTGGYGVSHEVSAYRAQYAWQGSFEYRAADFINQFPDANIAFRTFGENAIPVTTVSSIKDINAQMVNNIGATRITQIGTATWLPLYPQGGISQAIWNSH